MKTIKYMGVVLTAMLLSIQLMAQDADRQLVVPLSDPGKPYKLDVGLISGSIKVTGYEGKDVIIEVEESYRREREHHDDNGGMHRIIAADNLNISARERNNEVTVHSDFPNKPVSLVLKVPAGATGIKLATVNNGKITVTNVSGDLEITNVNGSIELNNISGAAVANTVNGELKVTFKSINPRAAMAFSTLNGNVDVTFPAGLKASMKVRSDHGDVFSDFDMVPDNSHPKVQKTAKDGMYRLSVEDWIYGKIAGGGPEILMKTMNGNIYIRKDK